MTTTNFISPSNIAVVLVLLSSTSTATFSTQYLPFDPSVLFCCCLYFAFMAATEVNIFAICARL